MNIGPRPIKGYTSKHFNIVLKKQTTQNRNTIIDSIEMTEKQPHAKCWNSEAGILNHDLSYKDFIDLTKTGIAATGQIEPHPRTKDKGSEGLINKTCSKFAATMEELEEEAFDLDEILRHAAGAAKQESSYFKGVFRHNIVIMAYKRSGSSFVGEFFNQHPDVMFFYEPVFFLKPLERHHGNIYKTLSRHLLRTIFTCNFEENPYFVSQLSDSSFRMHTRQLSEPLSMCPTKIENLDNVGNECKRLDVRTMTDMCHSHRHIVIKSIRIEDLDELAEIGKPDIEAPWNILKIVHLVRDPRAIISSRAHLEGQKWKINNYRRNARALCTKMLKDLKAGTSRDYNGMYNVVRYEDIVTHQESATRDLFHFSNLPMANKVLKWLRENDRRQHNDYAFSTAKNKTIPMNRWRVENKLKVIRIIEQECSIVMALLGYTKVKNKRHLQDISQPLFISNDGPSTFMTKNITDTMEQIMRLKDMGMLK